MVELEWTPTEYESRSGNYTMHKLRFSDSTKLLIAVCLFAGDLTMTMGTTPLVLSCEDDVAAYRDVINQALLAYIDIRNCQQNGVSVLVAIEKIQAQYRAYRAQEN